MGVRFERKTHKVTNGPMIFFSILHDEVFEEEIRSAYISGLSFYAYRHADDSMLSYGSSESYVEGIGEPGFVIGRFNPELPILTIPYRGVSQAVNQNIDSKTRYNMPITSTPKAEYSQEVKEIIKALREGKGDKVVAARVIVSETSFDIADKFYELCQRFPQSFVFCFSTPVTGCWIGATPELLLEGKENCLKTMALAGTRAVNSMADWDSKNKEEQMFVVKYLNEVFRNNGLYPEIGETVTKPAGKIEHICTNITCSKKEGSFTIEKLENLLKELSPTPALSGYPKLFALEEIKRLENFDRGCYGGFCGPFHSTDDFTFHVVLRCASLTQQRKCLYVGGGITSQSEVNTEWEETTMKSTSTFLEF